MSAEGDVVQVYKDKAGEWRWKRAAPNNRSVSEGGEGYEHRTDAIHAAHRQNSDLDDDGFAVEE